MRSNKKISNSSRIIFIAFLSGILLSLVLLLVILPTLESYLLKARRETTCELTAVAEELVNEYYQQVRKGELTTETAQARALSRLKNMRYGPEGKDYFWVNDMSHVMLMHPYRPDLVGQNLEDYEDEAGKHLFQDFVTTAKEQNEGYVDYMWQWKDDPTRIVPKVSHVRLFKPWNWIIGTGLYVNDIENRINSIKYRLALTISIVFLLLVFMAFYMVVRTRRAEFGARAAKQAKDMLDTIIERTSDMVSIAAPDGSLTYLNPAGFELTGYDPSHPVNQIQIRDIHPASIYNYIADVAIPEATRKGIWTGETIIKNKQNKLIPVSQVILAHVDEKNKIECYSTVIRNISKLRKMQQALQEARDVLEKRVRERTADLEQANSQLKKEIGERREIERTLRSCSDFERIINMVSSQFINCPVEEITQRLGTCCDDIGSFFDSEHCFIVFFNDSTDEKHTIYSRNRNDKAEEETPLSNLSVKDWQYLRRILSISGFFKCSRIDPPSKITAGEERLLRVMHAAAITCIPIQRGSIQIGLWGFSTTAGKMVWQDELLGLMRFLSEVFANAVERKNSEEEKTHLQTQLHQAQKMESVGQLAAGIAHEINTPIQFIGDNIHFFSDSFSAISDMVQRLQEKSAATHSNIGRLLQDLDWNYLHDELPQAIDQTQEGIERVTDIVQALKEFSHPGTDANQHIDLNRLMNRTLTVARNEWKHIALLEEHYDPELKTVACRRNEIGQVLLNIVVNACHAITDKFPGGIQQGLISIETSHTETHAVLSITDNGSGIPDHIRTRIFDPFFTTKEVGSGSGQGLYIAYDIVVNHHHGSLECESTPGEGTTFTIRLPFEQTS